MAIVVGTDTYISLADAKTYVTNNFVVSDAKYIAWNALTDTQKEEKLKQATIAIDSMRIVGIKASALQTLQFPRAIYTDVPNYSTYGAIRNYNAYLQSTVPVEVTWAQVELALQKCVPESTRRTLQQEGVTSVSLGSVSESYSGRGIYRTGCARAEELLTPYVSSGVRIS